MSRHQGRDLPKEDDLSLLVDQPSSLQDQSKKGCFLCKCINQTVGGEKKKQKQKMKITMATAHGAQILCTAHRFCLCSPRENWCFSVYRTGKHWLKAQHQIWATNRDRRQSLEVHLCIPLPGLSCLLLPCKLGTWEGSVCHALGDESGVSKECKGMHWLNECSISIYNFSAQISLVGKHTHPALETQGLISIDSIIIIMGTDS